MTDTHWLGTLWHTPRLRGDGEEERKVSWLELFYDLVFVVVISRLAHHLAAHPDASGALEFAVLFVPVWWIWIGGTFYNERFETLDLSYRIFTFLQMLVVAAMAVFVEYGLSKTALGFTLSYVAARGLTTFMFWRAGWHNPVARPLTERYALGFSLSLILWTVSAFVSGPLGLVLKGLGLALEMGVSVSARSIQSKLPRFSSSKLPERFGLFVIIVLGESLVGVVNGLADAAKLEAAPFVRFGLGLALSFGLWWVYFDFIGHRAPRRDVISASYAWSFLHLPLLMGLTAVGATLQSAVYLKDLKYEDGVQWILSGAFALVYLCYGLLERTLQPHVPHRAEHANLPATQRVRGLREGTALLALLLPLTPLNMSGVLIGLCVLQGFNLLHAVRVWRTHNPASHAV